jgi:hypothetical protein
MNLSSDHSAVLYINTPVTTGIARGLLQKNLIMQILTNILMLLALLVLLTPSVQAKQDTPYPLDIGRGGECVKSPIWMRTNHMKLLVHQRDEVVHKGIRDPKISLKNCIECHASNKDDSVIARSDSFCVACHRYESVKIDCFDCHSGTRKSAWVRRNAK